MTRSMRERDAILGLQRAIEQRTEQRALRAGESAARSRRRRRRAACSGSSCAPWRKAAAPAPSLRRMTGARTSSTAWRPRVRDAADRHSPHHARRAMCSTCRASTATRPRPGRRKPARLRRPTRAIPTSPRRRGSSRRLQVISNELIADSNPDVVSLLEMQVARALALKFDLGCFEGSGTPPEIRGLKNVVGITLDATLAAAPANLDVFATAITTLATNNAKAHRDCDASAHVGHAVEAQGRARRTTTCRCCWTTPGGAVARVDLRRAGVSQLAVVHRRRDGGIERVCLRRARRSSRCSGRTRRIVLDRSRLFNTDQIASCARFCARI